MRRRVIDDRKAKIILSTRGLAEDVPSNMEPPLDTDSNSVIVVTRAITFTVEYQIRTFQYKFNDYVTTCGISSGCISSCTKPQDLQLKIIQVWKDGSHLKQHLKTQEYANYQTILSENALLESVSVQHVKSL